MRGGTTPRAYDGRLSGGLVYAIRYQDSATSLLGPDGNSSGLRSVGQHSLRRIVTGRTRDFASGMNARPAKVETLDRCAVVCPPGHRTVGKKLARDNVEMPDIPVGQS